MAAFMSNHTCLCNQHTGKYSLKPVYARVPLADVSVQVGSYILHSKQPYPTCIQHIIHTKELWVPVGFLSMATCGPWASSLNCSFFGMQVVIHIASWIICGTLVTNNGISCMFFFNKTCLSLSACLMYFGMIHPPSHRSSTLRYSQWALPLLEQGWISTHWWHAPPFSFSLHNHFLSHTTPQSDHKGNSASSTLTPMTKLVECCIERFLSQTTISLHYELSALDIRRHSTSPTS